MTTLITRLFHDAATAQSALNRLIAKGFPERDATIILAGESAADQMKRKQVHPSAITAYSAKLKGDHAVLVLHATYKPLGAVRITNEVLAKFETVDVGDAAVEEHKIAWTPEPASSVLKTHPLILTIPGVSVPHGPITGTYGMRMLKPHRTKRSVMSSDRRMSRMFWPMKLVSKPRSRRSAMSGTRHMSRIFWPTKLLSTKPRRKSVIPGGGLPFSRLFGMRTVQSDL